MRSGVRHALIGGAGGLVALLLLRTFVITVYAVPTASMAPTLLGGDWILVDRLASKVDRGEVIVFSLHGENHVKRVIGTSGDSVELRDGLWFVNGIAVEASVIDQATLDDEGQALPHALGIAGYALAREALNHHVWQIARFRGAQRQSGSWTVPQGSLFVVGDNRDNSTDSREASFGFVPVSAVSGRATRVLWSHGHAGFRMDRAWRTVE